MAVPWSGVPLANLLKVAKPKAGAKYLRMETFLDKKVAPGQRQGWYPWPYVEALTIEEVQNELTFLATGLYGKALPNQNGARSGWSPHGNMASNHQVDCAFHLH